MADTSLPTNTPFAGSTGVLGPILSTTDLAQSNLATIKEGVNKVEQDMASQQAKKATLEAQKKALEEQQANLQAQLALKQKGTPTTTTPQMNVSSGATSAALSSNNNQPYYFIKNTDANGNVSYKYYDFQNNPMPFNPFGTKYNTFPESTPGFGTLLIDKTPAPVATDYNQQLSNAGTDYQSQSQDLQNKTNSLLNGTFPLTPDEQAQIDYMNRQFDTLKAEQKTANENYTAGVTALGITSGRSRYATDLDMGNIKQSVDDGIEKIAKLDLQAAAAVQQLKQSFIDKDLKIIQTNWQILNDSYKQKTDAIKDMRDAVDKHAKDVRDFNYKVLQDTIKNTLESDKLDWTKKQDLINNQINQSKLDLEKKKVLIQETNQNMIIDAIKKLNQNPPPTLPTGQPALTNKTTRDEWIRKNVPPNLQDNLMALLDYRKDPSGLSTRIIPGTNQSERSLVTSYANMIDPTFSEAEFPERKRFLLNWVSGQNGVMISANTAIQHLAELKNQADALGNKDMGTLGPFTSKYNSFTQWLNESSGVPAIKQYKQTAVYLATELAKVAKNTSGSNAAPDRDEIAYQLEVLTTDLGPTNSKAVVENSVRLMTDRLIASKESYESIMGKSPDSILYPTSIKRINELKSKGLDIDISGLLPPNPYAGLSADQFFNYSQQSSGNSSTDNIQSLNALMNLVNLNQNQSQ